MTKTTLSPIPTLLLAFGAYLRDTRLLAPRTIESYMRVVTDFSTACPRSATASAHDVAVYLGRGGTRSARSGRSRWNLELSALRAFFAWAAADGHRQDSPTSRLLRHRVPPVEVVPLSLSEMVQLIESVEIHSPRNIRLRNVALVQALFHTALRVSEVVSLNVDQVDQQAHLLHAVHRKGGKVVAVAVNDVAMEAIENYLLERQLGREGPLFTSQHGDRIAVRTVQEMISGHAKKAGIARRVTPHTLRHSSATQLSALGTPVRVIQDICSHSSLATTQRYMHTGMTERQEAVARLARAFRAQRRAEVEWPQP